MIDERHCANSKERNPGLVTPVGACALASAILLMLAACDDHREDQCENEGYGWCDNNTPHTCDRVYYNTGGDGFYTGHSDHDTESYLSVEGGIRCDVYDAVCYESLGGTAYCAYLGDSCASGVSAKCVGNILTDCLEHAYPSPVEDCENRGMICSTDGPGMSAECVWP